MPRVLVTGYGGFLGRHVASQLLAAGFSVRGLARGGYPELVERGVEPVQGSIADRATVMRAVSGCDAIVHTAAKAGVWGRWQEYYQANTLATSHLLEAAVRHRVRALVYTSSPSVTFDGQPQRGVDERAPYPTRWLAHYPRTKALAEQAVLGLAVEGILPACALRPHLIWGAGDPHLFPRVIERAVAGKLRRVGDGRNLIDVVHVESAAQAHVAALQRLLDGDSQVNGRAFFLTDGAPIACWDWISQILQGAEVPVPQRSISFAAAYRIGAVFEATYALLRRRQEPPMTRFVAAQLALDHYFSIDAARRALGYSPLANRPEVFRDCLPWLRGLASQYSSTVGR
ncbi:MAG: 3-beta hydroxysteroid dehydrogenase [Pirellulaceae bacterium]|nr:MAG: 3-beta hydroxysteroid dehydrogenase [Pirellulaceae bacterium]